ncbi:Alpha/Beta hydrolase protein [Dichotomocladium elegans]|nr:Alpha/Beta hydrolase protein [Dichotomocladium elegans]
MTDNAVLPINVPGWVSYLLSITGLAGLTGAVLLYIYQCEMIYPASFPEGSRTQVAKPSDYGMEYTETTLTTKDKVKLHTYTMLQPNEDEARAATTILYFHANAGNMGHRLPIARIFYQKMNCNVVMLSYRGYGLSEGKANEKGIQIDAQTLLEYVQSHPVLKNTRLVAYGQSIGGAVAIDIVSHNEEAFSGLIVENTFLSLPKLVPHVMPILRYVTFLCHQQWPSEVNIQRIAKTPVLFLSGQRDELIPPSHMQKLYELCSTRKPKDFVKLKAGMHNDTCIQPGYYQAIEEFLKKRVENESGFVEEQVSEDEVEVEADPKRMSTIETFDMPTDDRDEMLGESFQVEEIELEED